MFQVSLLSKSNFMAVGVTPPKTQLCRHYDVISYCCVSKSAYFVEHNIGHQPSNFQFFWMSGSNFMDRGLKRPQCYT